MEIELGTELYAEECWTTRVSVRPGQKSVSGLGIMFECVGWGNERVALLGPDGIVYKRTHGCYCTPSLNCNRHKQTRDELKLFRHASDKGYSWAPDFWFYGFSDVIAMPYYTQSRGLTSQLELSQPELLEEISQFTMDFCDQNFGLREDESVVLLDGGRSSVINGPPRPWEKSPVVGVLL